MAQAAESPRPETSAGPGPAVIMQGSPSNDCTPSPPPNCAICLGNCINKCFSDSCMHQFCFKCLLEWSKVKAVCPLCKQPFKSIIHNVKSNVDYDQHFIPQPTSSEGRFEDLVWRDTSRHFQFRTTLTVDPLGEVAIQHLLSTRSMTNSLPHSINVVRRISDYLRSQRNRYVSTPHYRRSLYERNLYTQPMTDVTGRYRETSPSFYRDFPGSKNRLVPFLQREINVLLHEERPLRTMNLVQRILAAINDHPIRGRYMKSMLRADMGDNTEHFLYEFYIYARSPYDLFGYDRHAQLLPAEPHFTEDSSDSDVLILSVEPAPNRMQSNEVIEIGSESSHDSDVVIREPTPPVTVDLANTTSSDTDVQPISSLKPAAKVQQECTMPLKLRHKRSRRHFRRRRVHETTSSSSSESDSTSTSEEERSRKRARKRPPIRVLKYNSSEAEDSSSSDDMAQRAKRKRLRKMKYPRKHEEERQAAAKETEPASAPANDSISSTSTAASSSSTTIKNEHVLDHEHTHNAQPFAAAASRPDADLNDLCQRTHMATNLPEWYPDYRDPNPVYAYQSGDIPFFQRQVPKYLMIRRPDEPGPSGMNTSSVWQPNPCSDSD